jgi:molybdate/tungstate transport system substrate-binding protein
LKRPLPLPALVALAALGATGCRADRKEVAVFAAASLARALAEIEELVERAHPALDVRVELGGSQEVCRKIAELHRRADVVATADYRVIDRILRPGHAGFTLRFATNEVALVHAQHSKHTDEISADNWPSVLQRPGVRLGMAAPDQAPIGYATLLVWQLAELTLGEARAGRGLAARLQARVAREHVTSDEQELLQLLQSRAVDYAFVYRSSAEEHNLKTVRLPDAYNLGAEASAGLYRRAAVRVRLRRGEPEQEVRGAPILYGLTIPADAPNPDGGERVVALLLGEPGQRTLRRTGFRPLVPAPCDGRDRLPPALRPLTR